MPEIRAEGKTSRERLTPVEARTEFYTERVRRHQVVCERLARKSRWLSNLRGLSFATCLVSWGFALFGSAGSTGALLGAAALVVFLGLVVHHSKVIEAEKTEAGWVNTNQDARARVSAGDWHQLEFDGVAFRNPTHPYADDLDLFGPASLYQRLCVAKTLGGQTQLAEWLKAPAAPAVLRERQSMIAQLAPELDLRQTFEVLARATLPGRARTKSQSPANDLEPLFRWGEAEPTQLNSRWLAPVSRVLPVLTTAMFGMTYLGWVPGWAGILSLTFHLFLLQRIREARNQVVGMLSTSEQTVLAVEPLFLLLESSPSSGLLRAALDRTLQGGSSRPSRACQKLRQIAGWFELRHNGLVYPFINAYLLWDVHCIVAFDAWRKAHGKSLRQWFAALGEFEALSSLAGFHYDEPDSCFADLVETETSFEAEALGHPLLQASVRVKNDVAALVAGHGLLVTGSNMSGKSTFLRAMGLGVVLGLAGGPVCARRLRLGPCALVTSMRISDSLASGVSHFYAELRKLKATLDASRGMLPVFFLLDEILHGTNSRERQIGARWILSQLLERAALGAVSTHDLALCELPGHLADRLQLVHFRENMVDGAMTFDYLLRQGPVTEGNALRLMRGMGLEVPLEGS